MNMTIVKNWLERECVSIGERSPIKKQDINQQLCRKLHIGENLEIRCKEYKFRKPKSYSKFLRRKSRTFYKKTTKIQYSSTSLEAVKASISHVLCM